MRTIIFLIFCSGGVIRSSEMETEQMEAEFISESVDLRVRENETIHIPCYLQSMENKWTVWYRNNQKIADTQTPYPETPANVRVKSNYTLEVRDVKREDAGEYSCEIYSSQDRKPARQNHIVNVQYPPTIICDPSTGLIDVELMQGFYLKCDVLGNPKPKIKWYFQNKQMPLKGEYQSVFNVSRAVKAHGGEYRCVADNSIGQPVHAKFLVRILFYPEIRVESTWVHSGMGMRVDLMCQVWADPRPRIDWFHDDEPVNLTSRISTRILENKYFLTIKNTKYSDFGNYSCQATNFLGRNYETIEVSGLANSAVFKSYPQSSTKSSYTLIWEVDSYSPVIQYSLRFRKQPRGDVHGRWTSFIIPSGGSSSGPIHSEKYTLAGLEPSAVYEASLSSKNAFGWSSFSDIFTFSTLSPEPSQTSLHNSDVSKKIWNTTIKENQESETTTSEFSEENALFQTNRAATNVFKVPLMTFVICYLFVH